MKKRVSVIALLLAMVLLLTACGSNDSQSSGSGSAPAEKTAGIEGTWKMTGASGLTEAEQKELDAALAAGSLVQLTFSAGKVTMYTKTEALEETLNGTYTVDGSRLSMLMEGRDEPNVLDFRLNGNTLELPAAGYDAVFTRQ